MVSTPPSEPRTPQGCITALSRLAHDWHYSDEFLGNVTRHWLGRGMHDGSVRAGILVSDPIRDALDELLTVCDGIADFELDAAVEKARDAIATATGEPRPSITCPECGLTSYNGTDVSTRYCGNCHLFHDQMEPATDA